METQYRDPYCSYLFQNEADKDRLIAQHELDVASFYGKHSGLKTEKYYTGEALLNILKTVFTHKKFAKLIKKDDELENYYTNNCKLLESEIKSNNFDGEHVFAIIINYLTMINQELCRGNSNNDKRTDDTNLHSPEITQKIRKLYGLKLRPLDKMNSHYGWIKFLIVLAVLILLALVLVIGACLADWYQIIDFSQKFTFFAPFITRTQANIFKLTTLLGATDLNQSSLMINLSSCLLILFLIFTVSALIRTGKTEKLDYKVHYLSRIIGESSQKLREIGWL